VLCYISSPDQDLSLLLWEFFHMNDIFGLSEDILCSLGPRLAVILCYHNPLISLKIKNIFMQYETI